MKQIINRAKIRADILSRKITRKVRAAVEANDFYVVEDICIDELHRHGESQLLSFKLSGRVYIGKHSLLLPHVDGTFNLCRFLNSRSWLHKRFYLVFACEPRECVGVYICDECQIADFELSKKAFPDPITIEKAKGIISLQLLSKLVNPKQNKPDNNNYAIHRHICTSKRYAYDSESIDDYYIYLSNGEEKVSFWYLDNNKATGVIDANGINCCSANKAFAQVHVNEIYYVAFVNGKAKYIFSADNWRISPEFSPVPKPLPNPAARTAFITEINPYIENGYIREVYGNSTVSVLNLADSYYAITDYRTDDQEPQHFVCVICDYHVVKELFNHPLDLPLIMTLPRKVRLDSSTFDQIKTLYQHTHEHGSDDRIDLQMEEDIRTNYSYDIFENKETPTISMDDWLGKWN